MEEEQIKELAEKAFPYTKGTSSFDRMRMIKGFIKGYKLAQPKWIKIPNFDLLEPGFYAIRIKKDSFEDIKFEHIEKGIIPYHYATHYCRIILPSPPQQ